jgi:hypothetical protein
VIGVSEVVAQVRDVAAAKQYRDNAALLAMKVLEAAGALSLALPAPETATEPLGRQSSSAGLLRCAEAVAQRPQALEQSPTAAPRVPERRRPASLCSVVAGTPVPVRVDDLTRNRGSPGLCDSLHDER